MEKTWILIRHPDKEGDAEGIYSGDRAGLTEKGWMQFRPTLARVLLLHPEVVTSSDLPRAHELAKAIANELQVDAVCHTMFREIYKPQSLVGLSRSDPYHEEVTSRAREGFNRNLVIRLPTGERFPTRRELERETRLAFTFIESLSQQTILTVSSAKRIAAYLHWIYRNETLRDYYLEVDANVDIDNVGITILRCGVNRRTGKKKWHIRTVNDTAHADINQDEEFRQILARL